jgi:hypothetical protein
MLAALLALALLLGVPAVGLAAEVLQVRGPTLLQVGDRNRSLGVELACLAVDPGRNAEATLWLRRHLPRGTRVNLRPMAEHDGLLVARVIRLGAGDDLSEGLITAGLASAAPCPGSPAPALQAAASQAP